MATAPRMTGVGVATDYMADQATGRAGHWQAPTLREITADGAQLLITRIGPDEVVRVPLNTPRQTWRWLWKDALTRVAPRASRLERASRL